MNRQYDPHAATVVLPVDELAARRQSKRTLSLSPPAPGLSLEKVRRLLVAAELRKRSNQAE
jgi:hypothetical protein